MTTTSSIQKHRLKLMSAVALCCAVPAVIWYSHDAHASEQAAPVSAPQVTLARALLRDVPDQQIFTGRMQAVDTVTIQPRVNGYVVEADFHEGAIVRKGQILFRIDPRPYKAEVDRLTAELAQARAETAQAAADAERGQRLLGQNAIAREDAERLQTAVKTGQARAAAIQAQLDNARLNLGFTDVRSPINGRVSNASVMPGNLVTPETVLTKVVTVDPIYAYFDVDEQSYLELRDIRQHSGELPPIRMALANEPDFAHSGKLNFVDNQLDTGSGTIQMRAVFPNADDAYTPGLYARIRIETTTPRPRVLVDDAAVGSDLANQYVYVVGVNGRAEYRKVETGPLYAGLRVIQKGLRPGETIVINGIQRVEVNQPVQGSMSRMGGNLTASQLAQLQGSGPTSAVADPPAATVLR